MADRKGRPASLVSFSTAKRITDHASVPSSETPFHWSHSHVAKKEPDTGPHRLEQSDAPNVEPWTSGTMRRQGAGTQRSGHPLRERSVCVPEELCHAGSSICGGRSYNYRPDASDPAGEAMGIAPAAAGASASAADQLLLFRLAHIRRLGEREEHHLFTRDRADIVVQA